jgi:hypothetical protein
MKRVLAVEFLGMALAFAGCGGGGLDGTSGSCTSGKACGGNIVGSWHISSSCLTVDITSSDDPDFCPGETSKASGFTITGDGTYGADLSYTETSTLTGNVIVHLPPSCLTSQGITATCGQVTQGLMQEAAADGFSTVNCVADSGCTCTVGLMPQTTTTTGIYSTTAAGLLTEMDTGSATADLSDYCVSGNTLTISPHAGSSMMGQGDGDISGTISFTRK